MELDELAGRLQALEEDKLKSAFMDKYGQRFSGNEGIGVAVLAELQRRGIDTSAADEAVQEILNQLRAEAQNVLDSIIVMQQEVIQQMDKIQAIDDAVKGATGQETTPEGMPPATEEPLPPPPTDMPPVTEEPLPPPQSVISDERAKTIKGLLNQKKKASQGWKPNKSMIAACRG